MGPHNMSDADVDAINNQESPSRAAVEKSPRERLPQAVTLDELAERMAITQPTISALEAGDIE